MLGKPDIKTSTDRTIRAIRLRRKVAQGTARTTVKLLPGGTSCEVEDGPWKLTSDLSTSQGGDGAAPDPGVFGRAALGACLVLGYELWAARLGVRLDDVRVTVESDFDAAGMYAVDETISPGWQAVRCTIEVSSPDEPSCVEDVIAQANRYSPLLADFAQPVPITCDVRVTTTLKE